MIPDEALESCRELLIALLEFADGDPGPRRHAAHVYHCYLHALRGGASVERRALRWGRYIRALEAHLEYAGTSGNGASAEFLRDIVTENADLLPVFAVARR